MWVVGAAFNPHGGLGPIRYISEEDVAFTNDIKMEEGGFGKEQASFTRL